MEAYLSGRNVLVSALTGVEKSSTFEPARIFRTTVSFSAQSQTSFGQFSFKIFLRNHLSTGSTNLLFRSAQEKRTHVQLFWSIGMESETPVASQATPHFLARNANENPSIGTSRPLATSSLARPLRDLNNGRFTS